MLRAYYPRSVLKTFHEVVDEIYKEVTYVGASVLPAVGPLCPHRARFWSGDAVYHCLAEPWSAGTSRLASTAFCLLYKLFTMNVTRNQMFALLNHKDSPYIRCLGFLHLRYTAPPEDLWDWMEPYLDDMEVFAPGADGVKTTCVAASVMPGVSPCHVHPVMCVLRSVNRCWADPGPCCGVCAGWASGWSLSLRSPSTTAPCCHAFLSSHPAA